MKSISRLVESLFEFERRNLETLMQYQIRVTSLWPMIKLPCFEGFLTALLNSKKPYCVPVGRARFLEQ